MSEIINATSEQLEELTLKSFEAGKKEADLENAKATIVEKDKTIEEMKKELEEFKTSLELAEKKSLNILTNVGTENKETKSAGENLGLSMLFKHTKSSTGRRVSMAEAKENAIKELTTNKNSAVDEVALKFLNSDIGEDGGFTITTTESAEIIENLYNNSIIDKTGIEIVQAPSGNFTEPKGTSGFTPAWAKRNDAPVMQDITMGQLNLTTKYLKCAIVVDNNLLQNSSVNIGQYIQNQMNLAIFPQIDLAMFSETQVNPEAPMPLYAGILAGNKFNMTADTTEGINTDLNTLIYNLEKNNIVVSPNTSIIMNPRTKNSILSKYTSDSYESFNSQTLAQTNTLKGYNVISSNSILIDGSDETKIWLLDPTQVRAVQSAPISIRTQTEGTFTYSDGSNNLHTGTLSQNQTAFWIETSIDFAMRRDTGASIIEKVTY